MQILTTKLLSYFFPYTLYWATVHICMHSRSVLFIHTIFSSMLEEEFYSIEKKFWKVCIASGEGLKSLSGGEKKIRYDICRGIAGHVICSLNKTVCTQRKPLDSSGTSLLSYYSKFILSQNNPVTQCHGALFRERDSVQCAVQWWTEGCFVIRWKPFPLPLHQQWGVKFKFGFECLGLRSFF